MADEEKEVKAKKVTVTKLDYQTIAQLNDAIAVLDGKMAELEEQKKPSNAVLINKLQQMKNKYVAQQIKTRKFYDKNKNKFHALQNCSKTTLSLVTMYRLIERDPNNKKKFQFKDATYKNTHEKLDRVGLLNSLNDPNVKGLAIGVAATIGSLAVADFAIRGIAELAGATENMTLLGIDGTKSALGTAISKMWEFNPAATIALLTVGAFAGAWVIGNKFMKARNAIQKHKAALRAANIDLEIKNVDEQENRLKKYRGSEYTNNKEGLLAELEANPALLEELRQLHDNVHDGRTLDKVAYHNLGDLLSSYDQRQDAKRVDKAAKSLCENGKDVKELVDLEEHVADAKQTKKEIDERDSQITAKNNYTKKGGVRDKLEERMAEERAEIIKTYGEIGKLVTDNDKKGNKYYGYQAFYTLCQSLGVVGEFSEELAHGYKFDVNGKIENPLDAVDYNPLNKLPRSVTKVVKYTLDTNDPEKLEELGLPGSEKEIEAQAKEVVNGEYPKEFTEGKIDFRKEPWKTRLARATSILNNLYAPKDVKRKGEKYNRLLWRLHLEEALDKAMSINAVSGKALNVAVGGIDLNGKAFQDAVNSLLEVIINTPGYEALKVHKPEFKKQVEKILGLAIELRQHEYNLRQFGNKMSQMDEKMSKIDGKKLAEENAKARKEYAERHGVAPEDATTDMTTTINDEAVNRATIENRMTAPIYSLYSPADGETTPTAEIIKRAEELERQRREAERAKATTGPESSK